MTSNLLKKIYNKIQQTLVQIATKIFPIKVEDHKLKLEKIGSDYGFAYLPENFFSSNSIIYSAGAGEDLHFELEMIEKYQCTIQVFDPTPAAFTHYDELRSSHKAQKSYYSDSGIEYPNNFDFTSKLIFNKLAIWNEDSIVKFFLPLQKDHVSHSITNVQVNNAYIEVPAKRIPTLMTENNHTRIDLLKLDIEGAEYAVIEDIVESKTNINTVYLECHYKKDMENISDFFRIKRLISTLRKFGFVLLYNNCDRYFTFIRGDHTK